MEKRSIIIVGSGPAGISTAISLRRMAPELTDELLILEKCQHPREKLCGGGLTVYADMILSFLGINSCARSFPIHQVKLNFRNKSYCIQKNNLMRIVHRAEFDADLVRAALKCDIEIRELQPLTDIRRNGNSLELTTSEQTYSAKIIVAADGARSVIRSRLFTNNKSRVSRLMEAMLPVKTEEIDDFNNNTASLDFRPQRHGLQGYVWDFPGFVADEPHLNIGIFDSRIHRKSHADLPAILHSHIRSRGMNPESAEIKAHPERWFHEADTFSQPNVLLTGDAAGIEPMLGEGISMALGYGPVAAKTIIDALNSGDLSFDSYKKRVLHDKLGRILRRNRRLAFAFYTRRSPILLQLMLGFAKIYLNRKHRTDGMAIKQTRP